MTYFLKKWEHTKNIQKPNKRTKSQALHHHRQCCALGEGVLATLQRLGAALAEAAPEPPEALVLRWDGGWSRPKAKRL